MTTALVFAANHQDQGYGIRSAELPGPVPERTADCGRTARSLKLILRARSGSEYPYLIKAVPGIDGRPG